MRSASLLLTAVLALTACGSAEDDDPTVALPPSASASAPSEATPTATPASTPAPTPSPSPPAEQGTRCENAAAGYAVTAPPDWYVLESSEPCSFFDPEPLVLPPQSEATGVAVRADVRDVPLAQAREDALAEGEMTVRDEPAGLLPAARVTGTLTGDALLPQGTEVTTWLVELGPGRTLLLTTDSAGPDDYARAVEVVDRMALTVEPLS